MEEILLYSTGCPKCNVLKMKMKQKNILFKEISSIEEIEAKGLQSVPYLQINNGKLMDFSEANSWINQQ